MEFSVGQLVVHRYNQCVGVVIAFVPAEKKYRGGKVTAVNLHKYKPHYRILWFGYEIISLITDDYIEAYDNGV
jgi:hypothetical protein